MKTRPLHHVTAGLLLTLSAQAAATGVVALEDANPFSQPSSLPLQYPAFDRIHDADYRPAFEAGMAEQLAEIAKIAGNPEAPGFDNTIVAMERSGRLLNRVQTTFSNISAADTNPEMQKIETEMSPKLAQHSDAIFLDPALFARVRTLHERRAALNLDPESAQLLERTWRQFVRAGAPLPDAGKTRLRELNGRLSSLTTQFQQNVLKATQAAAIVVDDLRLLDGFSEPQIAAAANAAKSRGLEGRWLITMQNTTIQPALAQLKNRGLRERIYQASSTRAIGGPLDNTAVVAEIVKLRAERAQLLGYPSHAAYVLEDETAGGVAAVNKMLGELAPAALANAKKEAADIQQLIDAQAKAAHAKPFKLQPWDWAFYAEQVRAQRYAFDEAQVRPYFELDHVLKDGVFYAAHELYGLSFKERTDLPVYEPDVRVFDVIDRDGAPLGIFIADYYARDAKQGGAWMNSYVSQSGLFGLKPVVANHLNIPKPSAGQPTLLSFNEVTTAFHEFGHALHGLLSDVRYPSLSGTAVPRDFVEYPSQYNEMWARDPNVLAHYAKHYQTGEPLPQALLDKVLAATKFGQGFKTAEYIAAASLDQSWHQLAAGATPGEQDVLAFEKSALAKAGLDFAPVAPRYRTSYFSHVFSGGYSAGYYAYLWSEVLARDSEHWMNTHGGLQRANGDFLRAKVLSRGRSAEVLSLFRGFYGQDPDIGPLLEHRGLAPAAKPARH
ncbi:MAG: M3 family metallopeptidase [Nevskia sp.]